MGLTTLLAVLWRLAWVTFFVVAGLLVLSLLVGGPCLDWDNLHGERGRPLPRSEIR